MLVDSTHTCYYGTLHAVDLDKQEVQDERIVQEIGEYCKKYQDWAAYFTLKTNNIHFTTSYFFFCPLRNHLGFAPAPLLPLLRVLAVVLVMLASLECTDSELEEVKV